MIALCAVGIAPAAAITATNTSLPFITSVQLDLPSVGKITINGTGFGSVDPSVTQSKSLSGMNETLWLANRTFNNVVAHEDDDDDDDDHRGRIAFVSNRGGNSDIYVMRPDWSELVNLTNNPASDRLPAWSFDGSKLVFRSTRDGNAEIYVMDDDGSNVVRVTFDPAFDTSPSWTPEGTLSSAVIAAADSNFTR